MNRSTRCRSSGACITTSRSSTSVMRKNGILSRSTGQSMQKIVGRPIAATAGLLSSRRSDETLRACVPRSSLRRRSTRRCVKKSRGKIMIPLRSLNEHGQVVWLDFLSRRFIADGSLQRLIDEDGLAGATSNPSIFEKAIVGSRDYDAELIAAGDPDNRALFEQIAVEDVRNAADVLRPVF